MSYTIEYPTPERLTELWPQVEPLFKRCCDEAAHGEIDAEDIRTLHAAGRAFVFVELEDSAVKLAAAVEFIPYPKFTAANVFALGGTGWMTGAAKRCWPILVHWMTTNNATVCDAWVSDSMARVLTRKLGFEKMYNHMRLKLEN